jgi:hypothetical protein
VFDARKKGPMAPFLISTLCSEVFKTGLQDGILSSFGRKEPIKVQTEKGFGEIGSGLSKKSNASLPRGSIARLRAFFTAAATRFC